jgi:hypothetical protein
MPQTTLDIDDPILQELRVLEEREGRPIGRIVSDLLAEALSHRATAGVAPLQWVSKPMRAKIDLTDKEALYAAEESRPG